MLNPDLPGLYLSFTEKKDLKNKEEYLFLFKESHELTSAVLLRQYHGVEGFCADNSSKLSIREYPGDFLIVTKPKKAIVVETADCAPVIVYAQKQEPKSEKVMAAAIIHAGWRGSVFGIIQNAVYYLKKIIFDSYQQDYARGDYQLFYLIGPAAGHCCYLVQASFMNQIEQEYVKFCSSSKKLTSPSNFSHNDTFNNLTNTLDNDLSQKIIERFIFYDNNNWYFDNSALIAFLLKQVGAQPDYQSQDYNLCTIHDNRFFSYRREKASAGRQYSILYLK